MLCFSFLRLGFGVSTKLEVEPFFEVDKKKTWLLRLHASQVLWHLAEAVEIVKWKLTILACLEKVGSTNDISAVKNATLQREASTISGGSQRYMMRLKIQPNFSKKTNVSVWSFVVNKNVPELLLIPLAPLEYWKESGSISEINNGSLFHSTCFWGRGEAGNTWVVRLQL